MSKSRNPRRNTFRYLNRALYDELISRGIDPARVVAFTHKDRGEDDYFSISSQLQFYVIYCYNVSVNKFSACEYAILFYPNGRAVIVPIDKSRGEALDGLKKVTEESYREERIRRGAPINLGEWERDRADYHIFIKSDEAVELNSIIRVPCESNKFYLDQPEVERVVDIEDLRRAENETLSKDYEAARMCLAATAFENKIRPNRSKKDIMVYELMSVLKRYPSIDATKAALDILKMYL